MAGTTPTTTTTTTRRHPTLHPGKAAPVRRGARRFRPTRHEFELEPAPVNGDGGQAARRKAVFDSRNARKARYALRPHHHALLPRSHQQPLGLRLAYPASADGARASPFKPHLRADVTFWVAFLFELGSLVWVANGFCVWLPVQLPTYEAQAVVRAADGLAFVGGSLFLAGAYLGLLEAGNRGKEMDFGAEAEDLLWGRPSTESSSAPKDGATSSAASSAAGADVERQSAPPKPEWSWMPNPRWRELGYLSAAIQMFAATIFWVSTLTGLPGVIPGYFEGEGSQAIIDVFFWTPQVIGGVGFVVSASILCVEVQPKWCRLRPLSLGWQIGFWNVVGAVGFLLCGVLGYAPSSSGAVYESALATFWGSWAFLVGSSFQVYEAVWREPEGDDEGGKGDRP